MPSRRDFLASASRAAIGAGMVGRGLLRPSLLHAIPMHAKQPLASFGPDLVDADALRKFATVAMDAATKAGADFADIRIGMRRVFQMYLMDAVHPAGYMAFDYSYGIRAKIGGSWAFVAGAEPSVDGLTRAANAAVSTARGLQKLGKTPLEFVKMPPAKGEWRAEVPIDPFSVSPDDHAMLLMAFSKIGERVMTTNTGASWMWGAETRVFASSDGALVTQHLAESQPWVTASSGRFGEGRVELAVTDFFPRTAGFEVIVGDALQDRVRARAEEVRRLMSYPRGTAEIGRYDAVFDGRSVAAVLGSTLLPALELARVLNEEADGAGTTYLAPASDVLGKQLFSPALNVTTDRTMPHLGAAKWDDEGVEIHPHPVVERGTVVDYFGTRANLGALSDWYASRGQPLAAHGTAVAWNVMRAPVGAPTAVTVAPNVNGGASVEEMAKQIRNGLIVRTVWGMETDQQLMGGLCQPELLFEVKRGAITRRLEGAVLPISSKLIWRDLKQLGNASTMEYAVSKQYGGAPWAEKQAAVHAPAGLFSNVDVTLLPREQI